MAAAAAAAVDAGGAGAVDGEQRDRDLVGLVHVVVVGGQVGEIGTFILEQAEVLAGAGEGPTVVRGAHVAAEKGSGWAGTGGCVAADGVRVAVCDRIALSDQQGMGDGVVFQARHVPEREGKGRGRFTVGRVERAAFRGMRVAEQIDVEGLFNGGDRGLHLEFHAVARPAGDGQAVGLCEREQGVEVGFGRAEAGCELRRRQIVVKAGGRGVVDIRDEGLEPVRVAHGEHQVKTEHLGFLKVCNRLDSARGDDLAHMPGEDVLSGGRGGEQRRAQSEGGRRDQLRGTKGRSRHGRLLGKGVQGSPTSPASTTFGALKVTKLLLLLLRVELRYHHEGCIEKGPAEAGFTSPCGKVLSFRRV